ncbi:MAG: hypothetical protein ABIR18_07805 [Chitinophagaceae bacterium]
MKLLITTTLSFLLLWTLHSCKSSTASAPLCDTDCLKDSIQFVDNNHPLQPFVQISAKDCMPDTLIWSYLDMGVNRKMGMVDLIGIPVKLSKSSVDCYIKDTSYAWLSFNDCSNKRGYLIKIPFDKKENIARKSSAVNSIDPKFSVDPSLIAYSDRGNIFAEDKATGKSAMMTFGEKVDIDYDALHESIDSVNITPSRIWVRVKIGGNWKEIEKNIELK